MRNTESNTTKGLFTPKQLKDIQKQQQKGKVKMITANKSSEKEIHDDFFRQLYTDYQIPAIESNYYHIAVESTHFDSLTGRRLSMPRVCVLNPEMFEMMEESGIFNGKTALILHNPTLI